MLRLVHLPILALALLAGGCDLFGGSSESGNARNEGGSSDQGNAIQVRVFDREGLPVLGARIRILPKDSLLSGGASASTSLRSAEVFTDASGTATRKMASGSYAVWAQVGGLQAFGVVDSARSTFLALTVGHPIDLVGKVVGIATDSLFVPGLPIGVAVDSSKGSFAIETIPSTVRILATRDGRLVTLDTSLESGFVAKFETLDLSSPRPAVPDTTYPKYYDSFRSSLPLVDSRPTGVLRSFVPDTVWVASDTLWIRSLARGCASLPEDGIGGWWHADSLEVFRSECPQPEGEIVERLHYIASPMGIWSVTTMQPIGYTWTIR